MEPAGTFCEGTLPERSPDTCTLLSMVLTPPLGLADWFTATEPAWFICPEMGSWVAFVVVPAPPGGGSCAQASAAKQKSTAVSATRHAAARIQDMNMP